MMALNEMRGTKINTRPFEEMKKSRSITISATTYKPKHDYDNNNGICGYPQLRSLSAHSIHTLSPTLAVIDFHN